MNYRKFKILFSSVFFIMIMILPFEIRGELLASRKTCKVVLVRKKSTDRDHKLEPEKETISAIYDPALSVMVFDIPDEVGALSAELASANTGHRWSSMIYVDNPAWHISLGSSLYVVTCTDAVGDTYQGTFLLE